MDFAVIIPTHGRPAMVLATIESVLSQSYQASEVIVVIDGSDPATEAALREMPVRVLVQPHRGPPGARNAGADLATSSWLCFLDDDDLWHPSRLMQTVDYLTSQPSCRAFNAGYITFGPGGALEEATDLPSCLAERRARPDAGEDLGHLDIRGRSFELLLERNRGVISTSTVHRDVFTLVGGFREDLTCAEDWMFFLDVARHTEWHFLEERLSFVRRHAGNLTYTNPTNGLVSLRAIADVWRSMDEAQAPPHQAVDEYSRHYRWQAQGAYWSAIRARRFDLLPGIMTEARVLLPRFTDRAYVRTPPPLTWRWDRLMSRTH